MRRSRSGGRLGLVLALAALAAGAGSLLLSEYLRRGSRIAQREGPSAAQSLDVVLLTIDTLRADALGFRQRAWNPEPGLSAREGLVFDSAQLPRHPGFAHEHLTGLYPYQRVRDNSGFRLDSRFRLLPPSFRRRDMRPRRSSRPFRSFPVRIESRRSTDDTLRRSPYGFELRNGPGQVVALAGSGTGLGRRRFLWVHFSPTHRRRLPGRVTRAIYLGEVAAAGGSGAAAALGSRTGKAGPW